MAELIDVACDICGQKYRWGSERVGSSAHCRECGTKFQVVEYTPPPADDATAESPWPWIRGACVAALVVTAVVGLGSLPFVRPAPAAARAVAADQQQAGAGFARPTTPTTAVTREQQNQQADLQARLKALRKKNRLPDMGQPGAPLPGNHGMGSGSSMPGFPTFPPMPPGPGFPPQIPRQPGSAPPLNGGR